MEKEKIFESEYHMRTTIFLSVIDRALAVCILIACVLLLVACSSTNPKGSGEPTASGKSTPTAALKPTDAPTPAATPTATPTTAPEPGSEFYLDPNDPAALRNPPKNEIEITATVSDSLLFHLSCSYLMSKTNDTRQLTTNLEKRDVTRYLVYDLGAKCELTTYYFTLTAEQETLSRSTENNALITTYSCVKENADYTITVSWTYEYVENYGWVLSSCTVTPTAKNGSLPFEDTDPFVFAENITKIYSLYTGYLDQAPARQIPAMDLDDDGIPDRIYRKLTYIEAPYNTYHASLTAQFSSGGELLLVEDDNHDFPALTVCDLTGDGRSDILFSQYGLGTGGEYSHHYLFTRNPQGEWQAMPELPTLRLRAVPVSDSEIILTHEGNTVAGPFCIENFIDYKAQNVANMDEWLESAFLVEYDETTNEKCYYDFVEPVFITSSDKKLPENPLKTVLACSAHSHYSNERVHFPFNACWNLWFTQDGWLITDVEVEPIITLRD